jgi:acetylornithine deacetylase/succinyl-diaminopimelate desuccinylase-like protein
MVVANKAAVLDAVDEHFDTFVEELQALCRIRSQRDEPELMADTASFIAGAFQRWGGSAEIVPWPDSHAYILGEVPGGSKRLLNFNHYDVAVEPTGDDADWIVGPYSADIVDGRLYARGVADDKAALMARLHAAACWRLAGQDLPVTSRHLVEGKKSVYSPGLPSFVAAYRDWLESDGTLWENSWIDGDGRLLLKLSEKGLLYLRIQVKSLMRELTSQNAAVLPSATNRLIGALATLQGKDEDGATPHLNAGRRVPKEAELKLLTQLPFDSDFLKKRAGVDEFRNGMKSAEIASSIRTQPTLTITGIEGGDMTDDVTLALAAEACAKVEVRLIAGQDPYEILRRIECHLVRSGFGDVQLELMGMSKPNYTDVSDEFVSLVENAATAAFGTKPLIEPYSQWIGNQGVMGERPIVGVGVSRADSSVDGPNEFVRMEDYRNGIRHVIEIMAAMADTGSR